MTEALKKNEVKEYAQIFGGILTSDGVLHDGSFYPFSWLIDEKKYFVLSLSSPHKQKVVNFIGRKVVFRVDPVGKSCSMGLIDEENNVLKI